MGIHWAALLLRALLLWTAVGAVGVFVASRQRDRPRMLQGLRALAVVWAVYLALLLGLSLRQPGQTLQPGYSQCFDLVCYRVERADELQGFWVRGQERERLVRVAIRLTSQQTTGSTREPDLRATLVDARGRRFAEVPGLSGVRLTAALPARGSALSEPVFRVPSDATSLHLELAHTGWTAHRFLLNDPESLGHRPARLLLPPDPSSGPLPANRPPSAR